MRDSGLDLWLMKTGIFSSEGLDRKSVICPDGLFVMLMSGQFRVRTKETTMDLGLKGRNAVVLGGTRGIGHAIASTLAGEGAGVAVCARNADQVTTTVAELQAMGVKATGAPVDITDAAALKS